MRACILSLLSFFCAIAPLSAQTLSPDVQRYIKVPAAPVIVLEHVRVIDGTGAPPLEDQYLVIAQGKITAVSAADPKEPADAVRLDLTGRTVFPGLVGMHDHMYYIARPNFDVDGESEPPLMVPQMTFSSPRLYLAAGVTTLRTTGSVEPYTDLNLRDAINRGQLLGPHMDVTGPYLEGPNSPFLQMHALRDATDAKQTVDFWAKQGVTSFKAYMDITQAELKAAIDAAHAHGLKLTGHLCSVTYPEAVALGIDNLEHGFFVNTQLDPGKKPDLCPKTMGHATIAKMTPETPEGKALIALLIAHHVAVTSTLPVFESLDPVHLQLQPRVLETMSPPVRDAYLKVRNLQLQFAGTMPERAAQRVTMFEHDMEMEHAFFKAGGLLLAGPDPTGDGGVLPGFGDQHELELLVRAGFTPLEAIRVGTLNGATYEGRDKTIGSIAVGKNADLVVVKGNPAAKISDIENTEIVFKDGVGYDSEKIIASVRGRYGQY